MPKLIDYFLYNKIDFLQICYIYNLSFEAKQVITIIAKILSNKVFIMKNITKIKIFSHVFLFILLY